MRVRPRFLAVVMLTAAACAPGLPEEDGEDYQLVESPGRETASDPNAGASDETSDAPEQPKAAAPDEPDPGSCAITPPGTQCGLDPQCGCDAGETCAITTQATGAATCIAAGDGALGHPCTSANDCAVGLGCERGACRPYCTTSKRCTMEGTNSCFALLDGNGDRYPNASVCFVDCDVRDPTACGTNTCVRVGPESDALTDCRKPGAKKAEQACSSTSDCARGLLCIADACRRWCRIGMASDCATGLTCTKMGQAPVVDGKEYGYCAKP